MHFCKSGFLSFTGTCQDQCVAGNFQCKQNQLPLLGTNFSFLEMFHFYSFSRQFSVLSQQFPNQPSLDFFYTSPLRTWPAKMLGQPHLRTKLLENPFCIIFTLYFSFCFSDAKCGLKLKIFFFFSSGWVLWEHSVFVKNST